MSELSPGDSVLWARHPGVYLVITRDGLTASVVRRAHRVDGLQSARITHLTRLSESDAVAYLMRTAPLVSRKEETI